MASSELIELPEYFTTLNNQIQKYDHNDSNILPEDHKTIITLLSIINYCLTNTETLIKKHNKQISSTTKLTLSIVIIISIITYIGSYTYNPIPNLIGYLLYLIELKYRIKDLQTELTLCIKLKQYLEAGNITDYKFYSRCSHVSIPACLKKFSLTNQQEHHSPYQQGY